LLPIRGDERDFFSSPIDERIMLKKPCHTQYDIVAAELSDGEAEGLAIGADLHQNGRDDATSTLLMAVGEGDGVRGTIRYDTKRVFTNEGGVDTKLPDAPLSTRKVAG
jgi:hypothetical protein